LRFSFISPFIKLDEKILKIFDSLGDLTIFSWDMPDIEIVYSIHGQKSHVSMVSIDLYDHINYLYPFDFTVISLGDDSIFNKAMEYFEKLKNKSRIFCILNEPISFYSLYRVLGGILNIEEIMGIAISEFGVFGKKLIQIIKDNESDELAKKLLKDIPLMSYLLNYSAGCLVTRKDIFEHYASFKGVHSSMNEKICINGIIQLDDKAEENIRRWLVDEEYAACDDDIRAGFQFIINGMIDVLNHSEYKDMLVDGVIRDMVRITREMI